jgi:outer membrane receptor protein involved in Fe transport
VLFDRYDGLRRLQFESNVYLMNVNDMMMRSNNGFLSYYNLGKAQLYGVDAELKWDIEPQLVCDAQRHIPENNRQNALHGPVVTRRA